MRIKIAIFCCLTAILLAGCAHPGLLARTAQYNQENIRNLTRAYQQLVEDYYRKLPALLDIQEAVYVKDAQNVIITYWDATTEELKTQKFQNDVNDLKNAFDIQTRLAGPQEKENKRRQFALASPLIGDVTAGYLDEKEAGFIVDAYGKMVGKTGPHAKSTRKYAAQQLYLLKNFYATRDDIIKSLAIYKNNVTKMNNEAIKAADAFVVFSQSKTGFADTVQLLTGQTVQTTIAEIVLNTTSDQKRRDAAKKLLEEINNANAATEKIDPDK